MRILKSVMILMIALVVLALLLVGYFFLTARVTIAAYKAEGALATQRQELYDEVATQIRQDAFIGTRFSSTPLGAADQYAFITYTLRLSNQCLVPIDMIEVQVVPNASDVLQIGDLSVRHLEAKSQGDVTATILTAKDSHTIRELIVTYYVWGISFSIRETYGG